MQSVPNLLMTYTLRLFELFEHAELHIFGQCGHWTQIEHNQRFNMLLMNFFEA